MNQNIVNYFRNSVFKQMSSMPTSTRLIYFADELLSQLDYEKSESLTERLQNKVFNPRDYVPEFQRNNNKWTLDMKKKFVQNVLKGVSTNIILCRIGSDLNDAFILDGQQRLTALVEFFGNKFSIDVGLDANMYYRDIEQEIKYIASTISYYIIKANSLKEACEFYIDMNENITHSKADIKIAYDFLDIC